MPPATDDTATTDQPGVSDIEVTPTRARSRWRAPLLDAAGVAAATVGLLVVTLRLWEANLRVPFVYNATDKPPLAYAPDAPYYLMLTKGLVDHGSYLRIPNLGWPFSLQLYDNPESGDNLQLALLRDLGFFLRDAVLTMNVYYLLTFVAVSLAAWFVLRRLGASRLVAAVVAILYSFLPYHFARGEAHLLLSGYFMVPIADAAHTAGVLRRPAVHGASRLARVEVAPRALEPAGPALVPCVRRAGLDRAVLRVLLSPAAGRRRRRRSRRTA